MPEEALHLSRLAMVVGQMHETSMREVVALEDIFGRQKLGSASEFEIGWQICELEHSLARSEKMVDNILDLCGLPRRNVEPFAPGRGLDCDEQVELWLEHLRHRCDGLGDLYRDLREKALAMPLDEIDSEMFADDLEDFLRDQQD